MGNAHSRPEDRLRVISKEVSSLRASLRQSRQNLTRDKKEAIVESLANQSTEISLMQGRVKQKKIDDTLKNISTTMEEVIQMEPRDLDMAAVESNSFVHMPISQRRANSVGSLTSQKKTQSQRKSANRSSVSTLRDIEAKFNDLKPQISTAIDNRDTKQLRVYQTTITLLAGDLELIYVEAGTPMEERKKSLESKITKQYQKIVRLLKEMKRDDNIQYLSKQSRKEKAFNDLADVELHLAENESLLDRLDKEKNTANLGVIRNNIVQINQRLAQVDIVDNEIKEKVVILSQKLNETVKNLDRTMAKREFDSRFAKLLENYERIVKNFNEATNMEATISNLKNLYNAVENLEEVNDTTKNRKRDLLANINKQLETLDDEFRKEADRKTIQKIVEDNVMLRKKINSSDKEYTVIDQFITYWNNVKTNFNINSYSNLSLLRIDSVLEEMQQSINDIRIGIANKCDTNPPTNLIRKKSQSVPRLNPRKSYSSNQSLDLIDNKIIKTKAKMYNISTPELLRAQKQQSNANNRFSKIEEIKMQVHYIKEKINESHNKQLLRDRLETYLNNLAEYNKDSNQTVANNAKIVSDDITELLHVLVLAEFKEHVDVLVKRVKNFNGTRYDKEFDELKDNLIKVQVSLENFNIPDQFEVIRHEKDQLLDNIFYNIESLQEKTSFYKKPEPENVRKIKAKLQTLSDKVQKFSGTYKGVLYNQIERDLNKLLLDLGEQVEDKISADETTRNVERLLKILEQRASIAQSFRVSKPDAMKTEDQVGMAKIKKDLYDIKKEIDKTAEEDVDAFIGLQSRLDLVNLELSQISAKSNENLEKEKEIFNNEAQTLKNVVEAKVALGQQPLVQWPEREIQTDLKNYPKNDVNKEMEKMESKFQAIKNEINAPNTEEDIHKYYKLSQDIKKLLEKLDNYKFIRDTDLAIRKTALINEMQYYLLVLEKEAKDVDYVISLEKKLDNLEDILDNSKHDNLNVMAEELQAIQSKLEKHKFNNSNKILRERKTSVQQKTDDLALKLKQMAENETENKNKQLKEEAKKIGDIEEKIKALRPEVQNFVGLRSESKFYELDETTMRLILVLDKFETNDSELQQRKIKVLKELHSFGQILDERAHQTQEIFDLEQALEEVSSLINSFSGTENELTEIKYKLDKTSSRVRSLVVGKQFISRKNACIERLSVLFNKVMNLSVLPPPPPVPQEVNTVQKYQDSNHVKHIQSLDHSTKTSSSFSVVTKTNSSGYTTQFFNFADTKTSQVGSKSDDFLKSNDNKLIQLEKEIKQLELRVNETNDEESLQEIDDTCTNYTIQLGNLNYPQNSPQNKKKVELFQIIENMTDAIEKKLEDNEIIAKIEHEINEIESILSNPLNDKQVNQLYERLLELQSALKNLNNPGIKNRIETCMSKLMPIIKSISDYKQSKSDDNQILAQIEQEVDEIGSRMNNPLTDEQINRLDERLIQLQVKLGKLENAKIKSQIDACMMKIILHIKNITDYKQSIKSTSV